MSERGFSLDPRIGEQEKEKQRRVLEVDRLIEAESDPHGRVPGSAIRELGSDHGGKTGFRRCEAFVRGFKDDLEALTDTYAAQMRCQHKGAGFTDVPGFTGNIGLALPAGQPGPHTA
jgi:hypothetical protein